MLGWIRGGDSRKNIAKLPFFSGPLQLTDCSHLTILASTQWQDIVVNLGPTSMYSNYWLLVAKCTHKFLLYFFGCICLTTPTNPMPIPSPFRPIPSRPRCPTSPISRLSISSQALNERAVKCQSPTHKKHTNTHTSNSCLGHLTPDDKLPNILCIQFDRILF